VPIGGVTSTLNVPTDNRGDASFASSALIATAAPIAAMHPVAKIKTP
jgi:hypothetical protein